MERLKAPFLGSFSTKTTEGIAVGSQAQTFGATATCPLDARPDNLTCIQGVTAVKKEKQQGPLPQARGLHPNHPSDTAQSHDAQSVLTTARFALQGVR